MIYPVEKAQNFHEKAENFGLFCHRKFYIKQMPNIPIKRILMELSKKQLPLQENTLTIEEKKHIYMPEFISLIKDFYLKY